MSVTLLALSTALMLGVLVVNHWVHSRRRLTVHIGPGPSPSSNQSVSVCIPARNEAGTIRACAQAILDQTYPDLEVIVIEDRSTDETA